MKRVCHSDVVLVEESKQASWQPCKCRTSGAKSVVRPGAVHHVMVNLVAAEEGFQAYKSMNMQELLIKQARSRAQAWSLSGHVCVLVGMWVDSIMGCFAQQKMLQRGLSRVLRVRVFAL